MSGSIHPIRRRGVLAFGMLCAMQPHVLLAQAGGRIPKLGVVHLAAPLAEILLAAFREGLAERGYVEGANLEVRHFKAKDGNWDSISEAARRAVAWGPDVIQASTSPVARVVAKATSTIPIVFARVNDPVDTGLMADAVHPGGNLTGVAVHQATLTIKRLELVRELLPKAERVVFLLDRSLKVFPDRSIRDVRESARGLGLELIEIDPSTLPDSLPDAFDRAGSLRPNAVVWGAILNLSRRGDTRSPLQLYLDFERKERIPVIGSAAEHVERGVLISLGPSLKHEFAMVADQVARIFGGERPAAMPVQWVHKIEMAVNLQSARRMGITVPKSILLRADRVIQ